MEPRTAGRTLHQGGESYRDGMRLVHRVRTSATPAQVWELLGTPSQWPQFDVFLRKVRGTDGRAAAGQHLVGVARWWALGVPLDVLEAVPGERLVLRVRTAPGVTEEVTHVLTPTTSGGTDIRVSVVVEGLLAVPAAVPLWLASGLTSRVLAARTHTLARERRRTSKGVA